MKIASVQGGGSAASQINQTNSEEDLPSDEETVKIVPLKGNKRNIEESSEEAESSQSKPKKLKVFSFTTRDYLSQNKQT